MKSFCSGLRVWSLCFICVCSVLHSLVLSRSTNVGFFSFFQSVTKCASAVTCKTRPFSELTILVFRTERRALESGFRGLLVDKFLMARELPCNRPGTGAV